jgi:hypothetical protein
MNIYTENIGIDKVVHSTEAQYDPNNQLKIIAVEDGESFTDKNNNIYTWSDAFGMFIRGRKE